MRMYIPLGKALAQVEGEHFKPFDIFFVLGIVYFLTYTMSRKIIVIVNIDLEFQTKILRSPEPNKSGFKYLFVCMLSFALLKLCEACSKIQRPIILKFPHNLYFR